VSWRWINERAVRAIHDAQIGEHGGGTGVRDSGLLESALARAQNRAAYEASDISAITAAFAFGIARNHPFVDGNKRTSLVVAETFLLLNGQELTAGDAEVLKTWVALAAGEIAEEALASWLRSNLSPLASATS